MGGKLGRMERVSSFPKRVFSKTPTSPPSTIRITELWPRIDAHHSIGWCMALHSDGSETQYEMNNITADVHSLGRRNHSKWA